VRFACQFLYVSHEEMGRARARNKRVGIQRLGPMERARIEGAQERAKERQCESRRRRREKAKTCARHRGGGIHIGG
jgi:hypothetical protein